ncbi:hypothetical protein BH24ACT3_BH24ACT3_09450 [soil metagenome]
MAMTAADYRRALVREVESLRQMVGDATEERLRSSSPCSGWSVLDVARHVEVTPRSVAAGLFAHFRDGPMRQIEPLPQAAGRAEVVAGLNLGALQLKASLDQVCDEHLEGQLPGPFGLMAGRTALDLALTELTLHRCDVALGLGGPSEIDATSADAILEVVQAWLLLVAPASPTPDAPLCYRISDGSRDWTFRFDGARWSNDGCDEDQPTTTARSGGPGPLALALTGRVPIDEMLDDSSDPVVTSLFKIYLPGP